MFPSQMKPLKSEEENELFLLFVFPHTLCFIAHYDKKVSGKSSLTELGFASLQARRRSRSSLEAWQRWCIAQGCSSLKVRVSWLE